jgi:hypothetical protein
VNISMNIDCTPEEARRLMGLPDLTPLHDLYLDRLKQTMTEGVSPELVEQMMRNWAPMGEASFGLWQKMLEHMTGTGNASK